MLAACGRDGRLVVWSVETGDQVTEGQCDGLANIDYEFARDGKSLIVGYRSGTIDQLRLQPARAVPDKPKVHLDKHGVLGLAGNVELRRNRLGRASLVRGIIHQLTYQIFAVSGHLFEQGCR